MQIAFLILNNDLSKIRIKIKLIINRQMKKYKFQNGYLKIQFFKNKIFFKLKKEILKINIILKKKQDKEVLEQFTKLKIG